MTRTVAPFTYTSDWKHALQFAEVDCHARLPIHSISNVELTSTEMEILVHVMPFERSVSEDAADISDGILLIHNISEYIYFYITDITFV